MKCPKCGYNSFELYDNCKKCSADLVAYKQTHGIIPMVLPLEAREKLAGDMSSCADVSGQATEHVEPHDDMFAFDLPEEPGQSADTLKNDSPFKSDDPFNFDDEPSDVVQQGPKSGDDTFANLLESTSQSDADPFSAPLPPLTPAVEKPATPLTSTPGEFDLENFSWDDPSPATTSGASENEPDDFDSLFGDATDNNKK